MNVKLDVFHRFFVLFFVFIVLSVAGHSASGAETVTFTGDATIGADEFGYEGSNLVVQGGTITVLGDHAFGAMSLAPGAEVDFGGTHLLLTDLALNAATLHLAGGSVLQVTNTISLASNALMFCQGKDVAGQVNGSWTGAGVTILTSNVTVEAGSRISADGQGYASQGVAYTDGIGPGYGQGGGVHAGAGGSYGGRGGHGDSYYYQSSGTYGVALGPVELGSSHIELWVYPQDNW